MSEVLVVRRRRRRSTPMRSRRVAAFAGAGGGAPADFPGAVLPDPESARGRLLGGGLSLLIHAAVIAALALAAWLAPQQTVEEIIKITRLPNQIDREQSAPRPKVVAESLGRFDPAPMAVAPLVPNPAVIQHRAAVVPVQKIDVDAVSPVQAPRDVKAVTAAQVDTVRAYQSVAAATTAPVPIDVPAPALAGPKELRAETGVQSGPKQVLPSGNTAGTGGPRSLGTGSSVREGIASNRDVLGAPKGVRADVNWAVGGAGGRGLGGDGTGPGGITWEQCASRAEVESYMARIQSRVLSRWILPTDINGNQAVTLRFVLDPSGTASRIEYASGSTALAKSAVQAMRAASPFDQMTDRVRCLAGTPIQATFRNPTVAAN